MSQQWADYEIMKHPEALPESRDERPTSMGIVYGDIMRGLPLNRLTRLLVLYIRLSPFHKQTEVT